MLCLFFAVCMFGLLVIPPSLDGVGGTRGTIRVGPPTSTAEA